MNAAGARRLLPVLAILVLAGASRLVAGTVPATEAPVLVAMVVCLVAVRAAAARLTGWLAWRRALRVLGVLALLHPALWSLAALVTHLQVDGWVQWALVLLASVSHLPLLAAFSALPLMAASYLGPGRGRAAGVGVLVLGALAVGSMVLFFGDAEPFFVPPLLDWRPGAVAGMTLTTLFVSSVLVGPVVALTVAWKGPGEPARRLSLVAVSALSGTAVVLVCGAAGAAGRGYWLVVVGLYAALTAVVLGCSTALSMPEEVVQHPVEAGGAPAGEVTAPAEQMCPAGVGPALGLTPRESEVVALLAEGLSDVGIAARLVASERTVDAHLRSACTKLDLPQGQETNRRVHAALAIPDVGASIPSYG